MVRGRYRSAWDTVSEEVVDIGYGCELFMVGGCWSIFDCTREKVESMSNYISCKDCGLSEIVVEKLNCTGEEE